MKIRWTENCLSNEFFSDINIESIQQTLRNRVAEKSNGKYAIGPQSKVQLEIIMRSIFLQYAKNQPTAIAEQIQELNEKVLDYSVKNVISNIKQHIGFQKKIEGDLHYMEHPKNMSQAGSKTLMYNPF